MIMTSCVVRHVYFYISRRHSLCYTYPQVAWLSYERFPHDAAPGDHPDCLSDSLSSSRLARFDLAMYESTANGLVCTIDSVIFSSLAGEKIMG
jgi:hypothetical protein